MASLRLLTWKMHAMHTHARQRYCLFELNEAQ